MKCSFILGKVQEYDIPGNVYIYDICFNKKSEQEEDISINQKESENKNQSFIIDVNKINDVLGKASLVDKDLYIVTNKNENIVIGIIKDEKIIYPENSCNLLYNKKLEKYKNKKYLLINIWESLDESYYKNILSDVLKVRSTESFIGVILISPSYIKCFQSGNIRNAQTVKLINNSFGIDTSRMGGPDTIWRQNKVWREGYELLLEKINSYIHNK